MIPDVAPDELATQASELLERAREIPPVGSPSSEYVRLTIHAAVTAPVLDQDGDQIGTTNAPLVLAAGEAVRLRIQAVGYTSIVRFDATRDHDAYVVLAR